MAKDHIDLNKPVWDQKTFIGRLKYFAWVTDPRLSFSSKQSLLEAKTLVTQYRYFYYFICFFQRNNTGQNQHKKMKPINYFLCYQHLQRNYTQRYLQIYQVYFVKYFKLPKGEHIVDALSICMCIHTNILGIETN